MTEEWKTVQVYRKDKPRKDKLIVLEGYKVERDSQQVRSFKRLNVRILKPIPNKDGYLVLSLCYGKKRLTCFLHRIMLDTYEPDNPLNLPEINHLSGIKTDNRLENLKRCSGSQNVKHAYDVLGKRSCKGEEHRKAKLTDAKVKEIIKLLEEDELTEQQIADIYSVKQNAISNIKLGKRWKHIERPVFAKKINGHSKLTEAEAIYIYNDDDWHSELSQKEVANKHNVSVDTVYSIKNGYTWSSVTGHIKGTKPTTEDDTDLDNWL